MRNVIKSIEGKMSWISYIEKRIKSNLNFLALAEGPTGIGKSWAMLKVAYEIDNDFEVRQVAFSFKDVMEIINSEWFKEKKYLIILFDEAQTDISSRNWQSLTNKLMNYLLSTFRHRNIILLFTSPYSDFLDNQTMKLMHCKFEIREHNDKTNTTTIRPKLLQYNPKFKKFYEHSLFVIQDGKYNKLERWRIQKPPTHLIEPYEKKKVEFTDNLNREIMQELREFEMKKESKRLVVEERTILNTGTIKQREAKQLYVKHKGDINKVAEELSIHTKNVYKRLKGVNGMADLDHYMNENPKITLNDTK